MKYILKKNYLLRRDEENDLDLLIDSETNKKLLIPKIGMFILKMCDGNTDFDELSLIPAIKQIVELYFKNGFLEEATLGQQLLPKQLCQTVKNFGINRVQWSITGNCNAKCRHCYISQSQHTHTDLTTEEMIQILDRLAEKCILDISITGGEPLLRPDLPILLDEMVKRNQRVTAISTNGFLLNDKMISLFKNHGMKPTIQISFDGVGHHDWMRGIDGAEQLAMDAIDTCVRNGIPCAISMCIHKENVNLIVPTVKVAAEHGASSIRIALVGDIGGSNEEELTLFKDDEIFSYYLTAIPDILNLKAEISVEFCGFLEFSCNNPANYKIIPLIHNCTDTDNNRVCNAIRKSCYISDEGRLIPCMSLAGSCIEKDFYKLTEHDFDECVQNPQYRKLVYLSADELICHNPQCNTCEHLSFCGCGCRGQAISQFGNFYEIDRARCLFFRKNWADKIRKVMDD